MGKKDKSITKALALITQIGISMLVPILLCLVLGHFIDKWLHVGFVTPILIVLGICAAFRNIYCLTRSFYAEDLKREQEELKYFDDLRNYSKTHTKENDQDEDHHGP